MTYAINNDEWFYCAVIRIILIDLKGNGSIFFSLQNHFKIKTSSERKRFFS